MRSLFITTALLMAVVTLFSPTQLYAPGQPNIQQIARLHLFNIRIAPQAHFTDAQLSTISRLCAFDNPTSKRFQSPVTLENNEDFGPIINQLLVANGLPKHGAVISRSRSSASPSLSEASSLSTKSQPLRWSPPARKQSRAGSFPANPHTIRRKLNFTDSTTIEAGSETGDSPTNHSSADTHATSAILRAEQRKLRIAELERNIAKSKLTRARLTPAQRAQPYAQQPSITQGEQINATLLALSREHADLTEDKGSTRRAEKLKQQQRSRSFNDIGSEFATILRLARTPSPQRTTRSHTPSPRTSTQGARSQRTPWAVKPR